jgi:MoxR-like ATPase
MQFEGTSAYVAEKDLTVAVNAAIRLERPLLVKGEPGTGKTELAARSPERWGCRSDRMVGEIHHQGAAGALRI